MNITAYTGNHFALKTTCNFSDSEFTKNTRIVMFLLIAAVTLFSGAYASNAILQGYVRDDNGTPVSGASIKVGEWHFLKNAIVDETRTNGLGQYRFKRLTPGKQSIEISSPGYETQSILKDLSEGFQTLELLLPRKGTVPPPPASLNNSPITGSLHRVRGMIVDGESGKGIPGARIVIDSRATIADRNGRFKVTGVPTGKAIIYARARKYITSTESALINNDREIIVILNQKIETGELTGTIWDGDGNTVTGAKITIAEKTVTSDYKGMYHFEQLPPGTQEMIVTAAGAEGYSRMLEIAPVPQNHDVILTSLINHGVLSGTIINSDGEPQEGVSIIAESAITRTNVQGRYKFDKLPAGKVFITVKKSGKIVYQTRINLEKGPQNYDIILN